MDIWITSILLVSTIRSPNIVSSHSFGTVFIIRFEIIMFSPNLLFFNNFFNAFTSIIFNHLVFYFYLGLIDIIKWDNFNSSYFIFLSLNHLLYRKFVSKNIFLTHFVHKQNFDSRAGHIKANFFLSFL